tara:strand:+ start:99 stop:1034 length:936 start_codon:yes stop_codon:yes gene_type:complete
MNSDNITDTRNSLELYGLENYLKDLITLYDKNKLPKILLLSGAKGLGKSTMTNHFLSYVFDKKNYDTTQLKININARYLNLYKNDLFENIIYLQGDSISKIKIDDVRNLKSKILKTCSNNQPRFIILDDVEQFNKNSLNALLKSIEEPTKNNYFILINNLQFPILETIKSRSLEIKFFLSSKKKNNIIESLVDKHKLENTLIDYKNIEITPGHFAVFHKICMDNKINFNENYLINISLLIKIFKKTKNKYYVLLINFIIENFFYMKIKQNKENIYDLSNKRLYAIKSIDNFLTYNLTQNSLINSISNIVHD